MRIREVLGSGNDISNKEIEESLWYYYFDLDKTISYLQSIARLSMPQIIGSDTGIEQHTSKQSKKQKQPSRFDEAAQAATKILVENSVGKSIFPLSCVWLCVLFSVMSRFRKEKPKECAIQSNGWKVLS